MNIFLYTIIRKRIVVSCFERFKGENKRGSFLSRFCNKIFYAKVRVGRKTLRNWLNLVQDLIQDTSWEKGQHKKNHHRHHKRQPGEPHISEKST